MVGSGSEPTYLPLTNTSCCELRKFFVAAMEPDTVPSTMAVAIASLVNIAMSPLSVEPSWLTRPEVRRAAEKVTRHTRARSLQRLVGGAIRMGPASNFPYKHHEHIQRTCSQGKADGAGRMAMETNQLVQCLVAEVEPVRRLSPPWRRSLLWLNLSLLYIAVVAGIHLLSSGGGGGPRAPPPPPAPAQPPTTR